MSVYIKNIGAMHNGKDTRGGNTAKGDQGTVRVIYQGIEYVFGPNETKVVQDNGIAAALIALDARLRQETQADGMARSANASVSYGIY